MHSRFAIATASVVALALGSVTASISAAPAAVAERCQCALPPDALLDQIDHVFIGDLVKVKGDGNDVGAAVIRVRENLKGQLTGVVEIMDAVASDCSWSVFEMASPGRYIVFANVEEGALATPRFCPQTQPVSGWRDRLAALRASARAHQTRQNGQNAVAPPARPAS